MKKLVFGLAAVAAGVVVVLGGLWFYATYLVGEAPEELTLDDPATPAPTPGDGDDGPEVESVPLDGDWVVTSGVGGYRVSEVLNGVDNTVVGRTEDVAGELTIAGGQLDSGSITVALGGVETDSSARDKFFRGHLQLGEFPDATFVADAGADVSGLADGDITATVTGILTLHGQSLEEVAVVDARRQGNVVTVAATIDVDYTRYGVNAPNLGFAVVEPIAVIEVRLQLEPAA